MSNCLICQNLYSNKVKGLSCDVGSLYHENDCLFFKAKDKSKRVDIVYNSIEM
jgi:hypothetical protein